MHAETGERAVALVAVMQRFFNLAEREREEPANLDMFLSGQLLIFTVCEGSLIRKLVYILTTKRQDQRLQIMDTLYPVLLCSKMRHFVVIVGHLIDSCFILLSYRKPNTVRAREQAS